MTRCCLLLSMLLLATLPLVAWADSWMPFPDQRVPDPGGEYYVVYDTDADRWSYHRRAPGTPAVEYARSEAFGREPVDTSPRDGDLELASGTLEHRPIQTQVSARGLGFVQLDTWGGTGRGTVITFVDGQGRKAFTKHMDDLFDEEVQAEFFRTVSSIAWLDGAWIDEQTEELVVVAYEHEPFVFALGDGERRTFSDAHLVRALHSVHPAAVREAIGLVAERKTLGVDRTLRGLVADVERPWMVRLMATESLRARGADVDSRIVELVASGEVEDATEDEQRMALRILPFHLGERAIPHLLAGLRHESGNVWSAAQDGFARLGEAGVAPLVEVLGHLDETPNTRGGAAHALSNIGSEDALPALLAAISDESKYVANAALNAAIAIGGESIADELVAILRHPTTQDGRLAMYFEHVRHDDAVPALVVALRRAEDDFAIRKLMDALAYQTGESHPDRAAWLRAHGE